MPLIYFVIGGLVIGFFYWLPVIKHMWGGIDHVGLFFIAMIAIMLLALMGIV